jgi:hypothetical protein
MPGFWSRYERHSEGLAFLARLAVRLTSVHLPLAETSATTPSPAIPLSPQLVRQGYLRLSAIFAWFVRMTFHWGGLSQSLIRCSAPGLYVLLIPSSESASGTD